MLNNFRVSKVNGPYIAIGFLFVLYVVIDYYSPKPIDWTITFHSNDKNPNGAYVLNDRLPDLFEDYENSYLTLFELEDSSSQVLILANSLDLSLSEINLLLDRVNEGNSVLIAANYISQNLLDTLDIKMSYYPLVEFDSDTVIVSMNEAQLFYSTALTNSSFVMVTEDSTWQIHAKTDNPILMSKRIGEGEIILSSAPQLFANYGILQNHNFAENALKRMPDRPLHYTQYYQSGKPQVNTPFRYFLSQVSLKWALYLSMFTIFIFIFTNSQKRQKTIPIITPLQNTTVQFIRTMAALFHRKKDHKKAADKLIQHFLLDLQNRFYHKPDFSEGYYSFLANKTSSDKVQVIKLFEGIQQMQQLDRIDERALQSIYNDMKNII